MKTLGFFCVATILCAVPLQNAAAVSQFAFATQAEGRVVLAVRDDFVARLSPFDRAARLKTDQAVSEKAYLEFVRASVLPWSEGEQKARVEKALELVQKRFKELSIDLPEARLVKTDGREEGAAAYTRGDVIVLPEAILADPGQDLAHLISHELFHLITRKDAGLRARLYKAIGFEACAEYSFPPALLSRKITNPDAPKNDHCIRVQYEGRSVWATPVLYSDRASYDLKKGGQFFDYLQFRLALADSTDEAQPKPPAAVNAGTRFVEVAEVAGFFEQVGKNTPYIIHPEEILADNFALLVMDRKALPSPAIPAALLRIFSE